MRRVAGVEYCRNTAGVRRWRAPASGGGWGAVVWVAAFVLGAFVPRRAGACSCAETEPAASAASADLVFEGTVTAEAEPVQARTWSEDYSGALRFSFQVARYFKGQLGPSLSVFTIDQATACGASYSPGVSYLVYAQYASDGLLTDSACSRTRPLASAAEDLALLGEGLPPDPALADVESGAEVEGSGCGLARSSSHGGGALGLGVLALASFALRRRSSLA